MIKHHKHKAERAARTPFKRLFLGALAAAGVLAVCFGGPLVSWYLGLF